jgi:hypothetical protein
MYLFKHVLAKSNSDREITEFGRQFQIKPETGCALQTITPIK